MNSIMPHSRPVATAAAVRRVRSERRGGFTLVELVVSIAVGAIICGSAGMLILNASKDRAEVAARGELIDMGSAAVECILRYVREISQDECSGASTPCLNGNAQVATADSSQLRFGNNGFRLSGTDLQITRDNGSNWYTLANGVTALTFTYYNRDATALTPLPLSLTNREDIRRVGVQVTLASGNQTAKLRTSIFLRNFMNEVSSAP